MGVFNDNYKKNAYVELEKDITQLESKREMPSKDDMARFNANVQFAQRLRLISIEKAKELRKRIHNLEYTRRTQTGLIDDGYENPLEREIRFSNMEELKKEIAEDRASYLASTETKDCTRPAESIKAPEKSEVVHSR